MPVLVMLVKSNLVGTILRTYSTSRQGSLLLTPAGPGSSNIFRLTAVSKQVVALVGDELTIDVAVVVAVAVAVVPTSYNSAKPDTQRGAMQSGRSAGRDVFTGGLNRRL